MSVFCWITQFHVSVIISYLHVKNLFGGILKKYSANRNNSNLQNLNNRLTFGWQEYRLNFKLITDGVCDLYLFSKNIADIFKYAQEALTAFG